MRAGTFAWRPCGGSRSCGTPWPASPTTSAPPLAGAMGYLQLLEAEPERREYLGIVLKRLGELEGLLDELFLYTRLQSETAPLECRETAALPPLWDALADLCPQLEAAGITPDLRFDREDMTVWGDAAALGRVYRNLIANALRHGGGGLVISGGDGVICFSNPLGPGPRPDPEHLFDRFYQGSPARGKGGSRSGPRHCAGVDGADGGPGLRRDHRQYAGDQADLCARSMR